MSDATDDRSTATESHTESHDPAVPEAYAAFMRTGWGERELDLPPHPVTDWARARRERLAEQFPGERLVIPAGGFKVRATTPTTGSAPRPPTPTCAATRPATRCW